MCGISGFSFTDQCDLTLEQRERLLLLGAVGADHRGGQSWGTLTVASDGTHEVIKGLGPLVQADYKALAQTQLGYLHSRLATQGTVNLENQHPFLDKYDPIVGAHNGVIYNAGELDRKYGPKTVDSEHIFERIQNGDPIDNFEGYGIIQWFDKRETNKIFLCNIGDGELTLFELYTDDSLYLNGYFWTSKKDDGILAIKAAGIKNFQSFDLKEGRVYVFTHGSEDLQYDPNLTLTVAQRGSNMLSLRSPWENWSNDWAAEDIHTEDEATEHPSLAQQYELDHTSKDFMEQYEAYRQNASENEHSDYNENELEQALAANDLIKRMA